MHLECPTHVHEVFDSKVQVVSLPVAPDELTQLLFGIDNRIAELTKAEEDEVEE